MDYANKRNEDLNQNEAACNNRFYTDAILKFIYKLEN